MNERESLRQEIQQLYGTFARYPLRAEIPGCACCITAEAQARIRSKPLRQLTGEDLEEYAYSAVNTWGDEDDFRHFLPRLLELMAPDSKSDLLPDLILGGVVYAGWYNWPAEERAAVEAYLEALWHFVLTRLPHADPGDWSADDYLRGIGQVIEDLTPFLDTWQRTRSEAGLKHLAQLLQGNAWALVREPAGLDDPWWNEHPAHARQVIDWLFDPHSREVLEQAAERGPTWWDETRWADVQRFMEKVRAYPYSGRR